MQPLSDYKLLRVLADVVPGTSDPDYAATQTLPADLIALEAPLQTDEGVRLKIELVLEWLDAGGALVTVSRGSFSCHAIRVTTRRSPLTGDVVVDTPLVRGQLAHRPIVVDDVSAGDRFGIRLVNLTPPTGATQARVLYREFF